MTQNIFLSLIIWLLAFIRPCCALDNVNGHIIASYFKDPNGHARFADVRANAHFIPYNGILSQGYDAHAAYWLKVHIPAADQETRPWVLRLQPSWHDDVRLYDPAETETSERITGDHYPWALSEFPSLGHAFLVKKLPEPRDVFIRIESVHSYQATTELLDQTIAERGEWNRMMMLSLYLSAMTLILLLALFNLWLHFDKTLGFFALTQFTTILYSLLAFGVTRALLDSLIPNIFLDQFHIVVVILYTFAAMQFNKLLLDNVGIKRWFNAPITIVSFIPMVCIGLYIAGHTSLALSLNSFCLMSFPILTVIAVWLGMYQPVKTNSLLPIGLLRVYFTLSLMIGLLGAAPLLGIMPATDISSQIFLFHGPLLISIVGALIIYRARNFANQQKREVDIAKTMAEQERKGRLEQSQFMSMLNHEIKSPLGILKLLVAGQSIQKKAEHQIDTVVSLLERCLMDDKLSTSGEAIEKQLFDPKVLIQECIERTGLQTRFKLDVTSKSQLISDPTLYTVIANNLLDNALKYSPKDSVIRVYLDEIMRDERAYYRLTVLNKIGRAGIPEHDRAFEKYYRSEAARSIPGTGLGLYLVKSFAIALGGDVRYEVYTSDIKFSICLPL